MNDEREVLDLVDENDQVIGVITRDQVNSLAVSDRNGYVRASDLFLINDKGEFWVPRRTAHKSLFPNSLDFSVGGHVESGEDYLTTMIRETEEEIGLKLKAEDFILIDIQRIDESRYFDALYIYKTNDAQNYNLDDFQSAEWLAPQALIEKLDAGAPAKTNMRSAIERILKSGKL